MLKQGDKLPDATLRKMGSDGPEEVSVSDYCRGRKVVIFALPGAFTRTCTATHVPSYIESADALKKGGVEAIACVSTSDQFVMDAWGKSLGTGDAVDMLGDGNHEFTRATGMTIDLSIAGLGERSMRYAMVVDDGVVSYLGVDEDARTAEASLAQALLPNL